MGLDGDLGLVYNIPVVPGRDTYCCKLVVKDHYT